MAALTTQPERDLGRFTFEPMTLADVPEVAAVDKRCFSQSWPQAAYRQELRHPERSHYIVLRAEPPLPRASFVRSRNRLMLLPFARRSDSPGVRPVAGFAGMWAVFDEAHVTTIGIDPEYQGNGLGELLLALLIDEAIRRGANIVTLEVRVSNRLAQRLYEKYGFTTAGIRQAYYSDNKEDALLMTSPGLRDPDYRATLAELRAALRERLATHVHVPNVARLPGHEPAP